MNHDDIVRTFVLIGFLFQACALMPYTMRAHRERDSFSFRNIVQGLAVVAFAVALVLHLIQ